ncbi:hypothetical protein SAY86_007094 [Trapa natans]|uniref:Trichome birefringence-like N-terminal domain-containing protein n=1 Tax=Trapa natans TaxID=22666 RepID=A0AAN7R068_TRANT|nr:hypothetical protein SAY86_007094 [Trapa natans]
MANKQLPAAPAGAAIWRSIRGSFHSLTALLIAALVLAIIYFARDPPPPEDLDTKPTADVIAATMSTSPTPSPSPVRDDTCDLFSGRWIYDNQTYPLYKEKDCKFMSDQLACEKYGRPELNYQHWRWQPHGCDLPRFNATAMLERLRNKRMVFVGDSLNRGQWVSMVCLVDKAIPSDSLKSYKFHLNGSLIVYTAKEYNATIEYYWEPLLVESNSDDPVNHRVPHRIVRVQAIEKHAQHWSDANVLVFDTYLWWRMPKMNVLWGSFGSPDGIYKDVTMPRAYEMALNTWSQWLEVHVNRSKTELFFVSMSPTHERAEDWGGVAGRNCYEETEPITIDDYWRSESEPEMMQVVEKTIRDLRDRGVIVQLLNITQLSEYRKEAHPTIYRRQWEPLKEEQLANPMGYADCSHWCLPGVPDVWNELLYALMFKNWEPRVDNRVWE